VIEENTNEYNKEIPFSEFDSLISTPLDTVDHALEKKRGEKNE
jgi:hypothetical protein